MDNTVLEFRHITFKWHDGLSLNDINIKVKKGDFIIINGPSGSGKSTLLRLASRLEEQVAGMMYFNGTAYSEISPETLRQKVALIQQTPTVTEGSVKDNLLLPYTFSVNKKLTPPEDGDLKKRLKELCLDIPLDKDAAALSVGQRQRLCILRTLLLKPSVLLMDEPTSALGPESKAIVENISEKLNSAGTAILMVSHSEYRPSVPYRRLIVKEGRVTEEQ